MEGKGRALLLAYGVLNAVLYSLLLPLWEGFDEPFHYAYVAALARAHPPSTLTREIRASLELAPLSHVVTPSLGFGTTYSEWFALPEAERRARREGLQNLPPSLAERSAPNPNYEAHQAPLAYALLALPDRLMGRQPLLHRVVTLRLICALAACLMIIPLTYALARELMLSEAAQHAAVFLLFIAGILDAQPVSVINRSDDPRRGVGCVQSVIDLQCLPECRFRFRHDLPRRQRPVEASSRMHSPTIRHGKTGLPGTQH